MAGFISGNATLSSGSVSTAALADNAVTLAKMAGGTDGNLIGIDASGDPAYIATGSDGQVLTSGGAGVAALMEAVAAGGGFTEITPVSTSSGTSVKTFTIPSGAEEIILTGVGVGFNAEEVSYVRIGDSGGIETSDYFSMEWGMVGEGHSGTNQVSTYIPLTNSAIAVDPYEFEVVLRLIDASAFV